jgi:thiol:disulfide interchange protein DsbA
MSQTPFASVRVLFLLLVLLPVGLVAQPVEDVNYSFIAGQDLRSPNPERIQVAEFFWYACPHCFDIEPHLQSWLTTMPEDVEFVRYPATFNRADVVLHAKTFFALEQMERGDLHQAIMDHMHIAKQKLDTQELMEAFLATQAVDLDIFRANLDSFSTNLKMQEAARLSQRYALTGVPALIVDGRIQVNAARDWAHKMEITDYVIELVRAERAASSDDAQ